MSSTQSNTSIEASKDLYDIQYSKLLKNIPTKIFNWLYLGGYKIASDKKLLKNLNIDCILNCAVEFQNYFPNDFSYLHIEIEDNWKTKILNFLDRAADFVNEAEKKGKNILIHCRLGQSRSVACLIAYMVKYLKFTVKDALAFIKQRRSQAQPNKGFMYQLCIYEEYIKSSYK